MKGHKHGQCVAGGYDRHNMNARVLKACHNTEDPFSLDEHDDIPRKYRFSLIETQPSGVKLKYCFDIRELINYLQGPSGNGQKNPISTRVFTTKQMGRIVQKAVEVGVLELDKDGLNRPLTRSM